MIAGHILGTVAAALVASASVAAARTAEQDHGVMIRQVGIVQLRPGEGGDATAPDPANCNPAKANLYPIRPDPTTMAHRRQVSDAPMWR